MGHFFWGTLYSDKVVWAPDSGDDGFINVSESNPFWDMRQEFAFYAYFVSKYVVAKIDISEITTTNNPPKKIGWRIKITLLLSVLTQTESTWCL